MPTYYKLENRMLAKINLSLFVIALLFFGSKDWVQSENGSRRIISDGEYKYEFYVTPEKPKKYHNYKRYFWFKSGKINFSDGGSTGLVLHGSFTKSFLNNNIAEQGVFSYGLKDNQWKKWYDDGRLSEISNWKNGLRNGEYLQYSEEGKILLSGMYDKGRRNGKWIDFVENDTLYFSEGVQIDSPEFRKLQKKQLKQERGKLTKRIGNFFEKVFSKKDKTSDKKQVKKKVRKRKKDKQKDAS